MTDEEREKVDENFQESHRQFTERLEESRRETLRISLENQRLRGYLATAVGALRTFRNHAELSNGIRRSWTIDSEVMAHGERILIELESIAKGEKKA
jgi:hypothetical protein